MLAESTVSNIHETSCFKWLGNLREKELLRCIIDTSPNCVTSCKCWTKRFSCSMSSIKIPIIPMISTTICVPTALRKDNVNRSQHSRSYWKIHIILPFFSIINRYLVFFNGHSTIDIKNIIISLCIHGRFWIMYTILKISWYY